MSSTRYLILIPLIVLFCSCGNTESRTIPTYAVVKGDFKNIITVDGYAEPINTTGLVCPPRIDGAVKFIVPEGTLVEKGDVVCEIEMLQLGINYENSLTKLETAKAEFNKLKANQEIEYSTLMADLHNTEAEEFVATMDSLQLMYASPSERKIRELQMEQKALARGKQERRLDVLKIVQQYELRRQEIDIKQIEEEVARAKEMLDNLTIKAPHRGVVIVGMHYSGRKLMEGDEIWMGMPVASIPGTDEVKILAMVSEQDQKLISQGDSVCYSFDAMPETKAWGKVSRKSPVGKNVQIQTDQRSFKRLNVKEYEIEASIDSVDTFMPDPGYTARCSIVIKEVKDTLFVPQISVFDQDSIKVAYVKLKKGFEMRQVLTGINSSREVIINAGLNEGDEVALSRPTVSMIKKTVLLPDSIANPKALIEEEGEKQDSTVVTPEGNDTGVQIMMVN